MNNKIRIYVRLWFIAYSVFLISQFIYNRELTDDTLKVGVYYLIIVLLVSFLNLIRNNVIKWLILFFLFIVPISIFIFTDKPSNDFTLMYVIQTCAPANIPIVSDSIWKYLNHSNELIRVLNYYLIYFILPMVYWYGLYYLAKVIVFRNFIKKYK